MYPASKKDDSKFDDKSLSFEDSISRNSPPKKVDKINTKAGEIRVENMGGSKKRLQMKLTLVDESDLAESLCVRFDPDDTLLASSYSEGTVKIFNVNTGKLALTLNGPLSGTPTTTLRWRPRGISSKTKNILLSGNSDGSLTHWHVTSGKQVRQIVEPDNQVLSMDYNLDGSIFATGGKDLKIKIYDEETGTVINTLESVVWSSTGHSNRIFGLKFIGADNPNVLLSGGWDANVYFWDVREKNNFGSLFGPSLSGDGLDYKRGIILTGSHRNQEQLQFWDFKKMQKIQDITWEDGQRVDGVSVYGAQFSKNNDETIFAGCGGKNEAKLFDLKENLRVSGCVSGFKKGIYTVDYGNSTNRVAFGGADGVVYVLSVSNI